MEKVIVISMDGDFKVFSCISKMTEWLDKQKEEDYEMDEKKKTELIEEHCCDTQYSNYVWSWFNVDEGMN